MAINYLLRYLYMNIFIYLFIYLQLTIVVVTESIFILYIYCLRIFIKVFLFNDHAIVFSHLLFGCRFEICDPLFLGSLILKLLLLFLILFEKQKISKKINRNEILILVVYSPYMCFLTEHYHFYLLQLTQWKYPIHRYFLYLIITVLIVNICSKE